MNTIQVSFISPYLRLQHEPIPIDNSNILILLDPDNAMGSNQDQIFQCKAKTMRQCIVSSYQHLLHLNCVKVHFIFHSNQQWFKSFYKLDFYVSIKWHNIHPAFVHKSSRCKQKFFERPEKWDDIDNFRAGVEQEKVEIGFIFQKDWVTSIQSSCVVFCLGTMFISDKIEQVVISDQT